MTGPKCIPGASTRSMARAAAEAICMIHCPSNNNLFPAKHCRQLAPTSARIRQRPPHRRRHAAPHILAGGRLGPAQHPVLLSSTTASVFVPPQSTPIRRQADDMGAACAYWAPAPAEGGGGTSARTAGRQQQ